MLWRRARATQLPSVLDSLSEATETRQKQHSELVHKNAAATEPLELAINMFFLHPRCTAVKAERRWHCSSTDIAGTNVAHEQLFLADFVAELCTSKLEKKLRQKSRWVQWRLVAHQVAGT